jgi:hypothetical protein
MIPKTKLNITWFLIAVNIALLLMNHLKYKGNTLFSYIALAVAAFLMYFNNICYRYASLLEEPKVFGDLVKGQWDK